MPNQPKPETKETRTLRAAREMLADPAKLITEWSEAMKDGTLANLESFHVYCALTDLGPRNDWNGIRSSANALKLRFDIEVVVPAQTGRPMIS